MRGGDRSKIAFHGALFLSESYAQTGDEKGKM